MKQLVKVYIATQLCHLKLTQFAGRHLNFVTLMLDEDVDKPKIFQVDKTQKIDYENLNKSTQYYSPSC